MKQIKINKKSIRIPESLDELSPDQYVCYLELVLLMNSAVISPTDMRRRLLMLFAGMKANVLMYKESIIKEIDSLLSELDGFFIISEQDDLTIYDPLVKSGRNLLPAYLGWSGPSDMLNDLTFDNFIICINLTREISEAYATNNTGVIDSLMANLCKVLYWRTDALDVRPPVLLNFHAFTFFNSVWELIRTVPIPVSGKEIDFSILFKRDENTRAKLDDKTGWTGVAFEVASSGVFGNMDQVNKTCFWDVLLYIYKCRFESLHAQKK